MSHANDSKEINKVDSNYILVEDEKGKVIKVNKYFICEANKLKDKEGEWYKFIYMDGLPIEVRKINQIQQFDVQSQEQAKLEDYNDFIVVKKFVISPEKLYYETLDDKEKIHFIKSSVIENYKDKIDDIWYNFQITDSEKTLVRLASSCKERFVEVMNKGEKEIINVNKFDKLRLIRIENSSEFFQDEENSYDYQLDYQEQIIPGLEPYFLQGFHFVILLDGRFKIVSMSSIDKSDSRRDEKLVKVRELNTDKTIYVNHYSLRLSNRVVLIKKTELAIEEGWQTIKSCSGRLYERKLIKIATNNSDKNVYPYEYNLKNQNCLNINNNKSGEIIINVTDILNKLSLTYLYKPLNGYILDKYFNDNLEPDSDPLNIYIPDNLVYNNCLGKYVQDGNVISEYANSENSLDTKSDYKILVDGKTNFKFLNNKSDGQEDSKLTSFERYNMKEKEMTIKQKQYNFLIDAKKVKLNPIYYDNIFQLALESNYSDISYLTLYKNKETLDRRAVIEHNNIIPFYNVFLLNEVISAKKLKLKAHSVTDYEIINNSLSLSIKSNCISNAKDKWLSYSFDLGTFMCLGWLSHLNKSLIIFKRGQVDEEKAISKVSYRQSYQLMNKINLL